MSRRLMIAMLASAAGAAAQCPSPQWLSGPGTAAGLQGRAFATILWDPDGPGPEPVRLVAGGSITAAGAGAASNIAIYSPSTSWQPMGAGLNGQVLALAVHNGGLYAGGMFTASGPTPVLGVAHWTGSAWEAVGTPGNVDTLASYGGQLIAGGDFGVMAWDGTAWSVFHGTVNGAFPQVSNPGRHVYALAVYGGDLIVAGHFSSAGAAATPANSLARWNGSAWFSLGGGLYVPQFFSVAIKSTARALSVDGMTLYIAGSFEGTSPTPGATGILDVTSPNVVAWTGSSYLGLNGPCFSRWFEYRTVGLIGGTLYVGGGVPYIPAGCGGTLAYFDSLSAAGGWSSTNLGSGSENVLEYNGGPLFDGHLGLSGGALVELSSGLGDAVQGFASGGGSLYAAGPGSAGGQATGGVARWDGALWHGVGFSATGGSARTLAWFNNELYIGGDFTSAGGLGSGGLVRFNGSGFATVGGTVAGTVRAMAPYNNALVVAGSIPTFGPLTTPNIAQWNGSVWQPLGTGLNGGVNALAVHNGALYAAGAFVPGNNIARFDGVTWTLVPGAFNLAPGALASYNGLLYAGGAFAQAGSALASRIAAFDGSTWSDVGGGMNGTVAALLTFNNRLYAAGSFQQAGFASAPGFAAWDGLAWTAPDGGLAPESTAAALGSFGDELVVGGSFTATSRGVSSQWARLGCPSSCYPNCDNSTTAPILNISDFSCFINRFAAGDSYANCDGSTTDPVLNVADFGCFLNAFAAGCT